MRKNPRPVLSLAALKEAFPEMTFRLRDKEYRVNFRDGKEATAYYTNDPLDAYHTAQAMLTTDSRARQGQGYERNPRENPRAWDSDTSMHENPRGDSAVMTRQHFEFIARVIRWLNVSFDDRRMIAQDFADELNKTNANFNKERFIEAATRMK